nr:zinc finger, CCHC-type [Tanacetum cinerariifolium]
STSEGQEFDSIPRFNVESLSNINSRDEPPTVRKSDRVRHLPPKFNDYVLPSNKNDLHKDVYMDLPPGYYDFSKAKVFSTWMAFGGTTCDLGSFEEEMDEIMNLHHILEDVLLTVYGDGVAGIMRRHRDPFGHGVRDLVMASGPGSITTWEDLTTHFLAQFFPPGRTAKLRNDILMFQQIHGESLSEAWTRFKDLLQKVPLYGIDCRLQIQIFYDHVSFHLKGEIDRAAGGKLHNKKTFRVVTQRGVN